MSSCSSRIGGWKTDRIPREIYTHLADADIANQVDAIRAFYSKNHNENTNQFHKI